MATDAHSTLDPDGTLRARADAIKADFLENRWERYMEMVHRLESHPENQDGADKTWVARLVKSYQDLFRKAVRVS